MIGKSNDLSSRLKHAISHFKQDYPTEKIVFASSGSVLVSKDIHLKPNFFRWYFAKRTNIIISERRLYIKSFSLSFNAISVLLSIILTIGAFIYFTFFLPRMDIPIVNELLLFTKFFIGFIIAFLIVIYFYGCIPYSKVIRLGEINTAYIRPIRILLTYFPHI